MIYLKSVVAGIVTVVATTLMYSAIMHAYLQTRLWMYRRANPGDTYFIVVHWHFSALSLIPDFAVFLCGAYWMFRRLRTQQRN
jgi:hypothetical protein